MVCLRNMCMATLHKGDNDAIRIMMIMIMMMMMIIIIMIIIIIIITIIIVERQIRLFT